MSIEKPTNEQETIFNFIGRESIHGFIITDFWSIFPDAHVQDSRTGKMYKVEFEYRLSSFVKHNHDPFKCDFVICWINDFGKIPLTVWEVSKNSYPTIKTARKKELQKFADFIVAKNTPKPRGFSSKEEIGRMFQSLKNITESRMKNDE